MPRTRRSNTTSNGRSDNFTVPIERLAAPALCRDLVKLLLRRGWTIARIAGIIRADDAFVRRVESGIQGFSERDLKALARAERTDPLVLLFAALEASAVKAGTQDLYESTRRVLEVTGRYRQFSGEPARKKKRPSTRAA